MFEHEFFRNALVAGLLVAIVCGIMGALVVVNRLVGLAGGIAHATYGGLGLAGFLAWPPMVGLFGFGMASATLMGWLTWKDKEKADSLIGVLWSVGMAMGVVFVDLTPGYGADLMGMLFGSILTVSREMLLWMGLLAAVVVVLVWWYFPEFQAISHDPEFALLRGVPVARLHMLLVLLVALAVILAVQAVGMILVIALLTIPARIAARHTRSLAGMMFGATAVGIVLVLGGLMLSWWLNLTAGPMIILTGALVFFVDALIQKQRLHRTSQVVAPLLLLALALPGMAHAERSLFQNPLIRTSYSPMLAAKNAQADSLLPALDGDMAFAELLRTTPGLWSMERLDRHGDIETKVAIDLIYIDGTREEPFCRMQKDSASSSGNWNLAMGVDFTSGGSNIVAIHVRQCLDWARNELGYLVRKGEQIVEVPPRKVLEEAKQNQIPDAIDPDLKARLVQAHREVDTEGKCPTDIRSYAILLDVWLQVGTTPMDLVELSQRFAERDKPSQVMSCAFSREWNQRYSETAVLRCDADKNSCIYTQSQDGTTRWSLDAESGRLRYQPLRILGIPWGRRRSVHHGGTMLDLQVIQLSTRLFLEAYLDKDGKPVTLGLITLGE